jgi:hypothetical protein
MCDAKCVPENYVGIVNIGIAVGYPFWNSFRGFARCLGDMAARRVDLLIVIYNSVSLGEEQPDNGLTSCNMDSMSCESSTLPD